jgi:hypothetical protein
MATRQRKKTQKPRRPARALSVGQGKLEQAPRPTADWAKSAKLLGFIMRLGMHGNVTRAIAGAQVDRGYCYDKRNTDTEFAAAWDEAKKMGLDVLKDEAWRRAHEGVEKTKFYQGLPIKVASGKGKNRRMVDYVEREYSDTLLMFLIKQADPSFREHYDVNLGNAGGRPFMFQMVLHPEAAKIAAAARTGRK